MVCTLEDLIDRRAGFLYWNAEKRLERLRHGANVIRTELDLSESEFESQFVAYSEHLQRFHSLPATQITRQIVSPLVKFLSWIMSGKVLLFRVERLCLKSQDSLLDTVSTVTR